MAAKKFPIYVMYRAPRRYLDEFIMRIDDGVKNEGHKNALFLQESDDDTGHTSTHVRAYLNHSIEDLAIININKFWNNRTVTSSKYFTVLTDSLARRDLVEIACIGHNPQNPEDTPNRDNLSIRTFTIHIKDASMCLISLGSGEMEIEDWLA
ncbi:hypothetical protein E3P92_03911 [Wallemia ichthyophaga]|uniref:Uncharacterized protein n=2 Tax=Wallemia ichthyophaga TaxID=245174 RepID=A0A4T0E587_WALIC|nr:uncharacterized protein J056_003217 [Wallemia ichthyophaga EXF-994]TIA68726.1 hypothetical protein E3P91_03950 [Wallemia ichthyophaga]EOQ98697.1 hypothetical protein J056_003217 [Wallemia ichthyophaga EXF-994]TIB07327.1 hypothetical protein E3P93_03885 [Wallemia ichthyophaga]TIB07846.1 hypothetical protein E3P90_03888 [Wallemia ichthyophaga]TIB07977.1 hypothetical protein E3P92_03911 [Wallemia ichthyophaga]